MILKKWLTILGLILLLPVIIKAENSPIALYFAGVKVDSQEIKVIEKNGVKFINLPFLIRYLHVSNDWNPDEGDLLLRFGKYTINMYEDSTKYYSNGQPRFLPAAPFEKDGELWIPAAFYLRLGLVVKHDDAQQLSLDWEANYLLGFEETTYQGRPAFVLVGTRPFKTRSFILTNPSRLVLELTGLKLHWAFDGGIGENPVVKKVRFSQMSPETLRLVFDLNKLLGYQLIPVPERENQLMLVLNYSVEEVSFYQKGEERKVYIKSSYPAKYQVTSFQEPSRLVIDLEGATLTGSSEPITGDGEWVKRVRMSQFSPGKVRVVLDLIGSTPSFVIPVRDNPNLIEVRTTQQIEKVQWIQGKDGGNLIVEGNGQLMETIRKSKNPYQLQLDFNYAQFVPGISVPAFKSDQIKGLRLIAVNYSLARIELDLNYYLGYTLQYSPDRRQLIVGLRPSPVANKSIVLDAGHGGVDMGACGRQGTREKDVNLEVTMRLKDLLEEAGANVVLTRTDDSFISLYERPFLANYLFSDVFVSVHTNNHPSFKIQGIEVYHYPGRSEAKQLAKVVHDQLVKATKLGTLGVKTNDFCVIRETQMPSILIELGFLSNFQEETTLRTTEFRVNAAEGIFRGLIEYFEK